MKFEVNNHQVTFWSKEFVNFSVSSSWSFSIDLQQQESKQKNL